MLSFRLNICKAYLVRIVVAAPFNFGSRKVC